MQAAGADQSGNAVEASEKLLVPAESKKLIRKSEIVMQVKSVSDSRKQLLSQVRRLNGYVETELTTNSTAETKLQITLRVPNKLFEQLIDSAIVEAQYLESNNITSKDISSVYIDIESRLKTKRTVMERYQSFITRAEKMSDVLEIEKEIRLLQEEIESTESQLKAMSNDVSYSTIHITAYELRPAGLVPAIGYGHRFAEAFLSGWTELMSFIISLVHAWPLVIVISVLFYFGRRLLRKANKTQHGSIH